MDNNSFSKFVTPIVFMFVGCFIFFNAFRKYKLKQLMDNIPTSKIRSMALGLVEIKAKVAEPYSNFLKSPFSNKDCVFYKYEVQEYRKSKDRSYWSTISSHSRYVPFFVEDNTGKVLVDMLDAETHLPSDNTFYNQRGRGMLPPHFNLVEEIAAENFLGMKRNLRFIETYLEPEDSIYILGTAENHNYKNLKVDEFGHTHLILRKGSNSPVFLISDQSEKEYGKSLKWTYTSQIVAGPGVILYGLYKILEEFNLF